MLIDYRTADPDIRFRIQAGGRDRAKIVIELPNKQPYFDEITAVVSNLIRLRFDRDVDTTKAVTVGA